ncbi:hypothetical protein FisN_8Lh017 [Fistulifera solaris]|uniref:Uncharacterized protein n=1 Tax=Fistulifera solaris TaxID=1519565 RepID=A0A1Z5JDU1_FISSO|nr:hypothetical protein FisN_8Lh017 [Fistulifera solaris]|eukprot:GAX11931.1 hypothetical protein FisN_8Lh017 [Fistulifera solaris]
MQQSSLASLSKSPSPSPLSPLGSLGTEQSSSPNKPIRRSSVKAESIKDYIAPIDILETNQSTPQSELKMPLRRPYVASGTFSSDMIQPAQRKRSTSATGKIQSHTSSLPSHSVSTALRMPVRRSSLKSSFQRNSSCQSYFEDETSIRLAKSLPKPERNSSFDQDDEQQQGKNELQSTLSTSPPSAEASPSKRRSGFEAFRQVLTMPVRRSSLHGDSNSPKNATKNESPQQQRQRRTHRTSSYESYAEEQARIRAAAFNCGLGEREENIFQRNDSFASSNSSSLDGEITTNASFASSSESSVERMLRNESFASSDSDFEEIEDESTEEMLNESSDSSSEVDIIKEEPSNAEKHEEDFSIDVDESHNDEEEYKKYYQDEVEKRDVTSSTFENESCCEVPDSSTTKSNVLRRAWKRLSLNHSQPSIDDDMKDIWSKTRSDSKLPRRGSLNHMLYTHWKSSHADSTQTSPLQRKASLHRSRRWSMTSNASTLRTVSTAASTVSSLSAASSLVGPLGHGIAQREVVTMGPSPTGTTTQSSKSRWWKQTTRRLSLSTTREKSMNSQL